MGDGATSAGATLGAARYAERPATTGAARKARERRARAQARHVCWLASNYQALTAHHTAGLPHRPLDEAMLPGERAALKSAVALLRDEAQLLRAKLVHGAAATEPVASGAAAFSGPGDGGSSVGVAPKMTKTQSLVELVERVEVKLAEAAKTVPVKLVAFKHVDMACRS